MHPELIKARLRMAGYTLADVARETQTEFGRRKGDCPDYGQAPARIVPRTVDGRRAAYPPALPLFV